MAIDNRDGEAFLTFVTDKLKTRIAHISESILEGQKDIEGMHEYYWENYTEMDQYGYENFDNQQALLHQINANEQQIHLRKRFRKMLDLPHGRSGRNRGCRRQWPGPCVACSATSYHR